MPASRPLRWVARELAQPTRLDKVLRASYPDWGRQAVQRLISGRRVTVNGRTVWLASWLVHNGDTLEVADPPRAKQPGLTAFDDAWLIAVEPDLVAVDKPAGLLSEAARAAGYANLHDLARARFGELILIHRLDRDTSGVLLLTRPGPVNAYLTAAFKDHSVEKEYLAVVERPNRLATAGLIDARLAPQAARRDMMEVVEQRGQPARTRYAVVEESGRRQLVRLWPETGRTHQLRVHLAYMGAPILGDRLYNKAAAPEQRLYLHAHRLALPQAANFPAREFVAPLPPGFWPPAAP